MAEFLVGAVRGAAGEPPCTERRGGTERPSTALAEASLVQSSTLTQLAEVKLHGWLLRPGRWRPGCCVDSRDTSCPPSPSSSPTCGHGTAYQQHAGRVFPPPPDACAPDMANVSLAIPAIHPINDTQLGAGGQPPAGVSQRGTVRPPPPTGHSSTRQDHNGVDRRGPQPGGRRTGASARAQPTMPAGLSPPPPAAGPGPGWPTRRPAEGQRPGRPGDSLSGRQSPKHR